MRKPKYSVGTDIVDVPRIARLVKNPNFLKRVFSAEEVRYCKDKKNAAQHFAVRFAAKEAVWKAFASTGRIKGMAHKEISVRRLPSGQPLVQLSPRLRKFENHFSLSLSHTKDYAVAVAIYFGS